MEKNPFTTKNSKTLNNIPLSQSGILYKDNSSNNLTVNNPFQVNTQTGAKVKKLSGYKTQIETSPIEQYDPLAQSAHFQDYSYKNNEVIVKPPIIETGNLQQDIFTNTGNFDFLGDIKTEATNQTYENNITDLNYIQSSPFEQNITGPANNSTDINILGQNTNFGNENGTNSVKYLPTIYADNNNLSEILNRLKDNNDLNYDNNNILSSKPIYTNLENNNLNPFSDTGILIPETQNLNIENNIFQNITSVETGNFNISEITSTPINNTFSTQEINTDFPLISNKNTDNTSLTNFTLGSGTNFEEYPTISNIGNDIIQNSYPKEFGNIFPLSGKQEGIIQTENIGPVTPTSSIDDYKPGKNIVDNSFLLNNVIPKQNIVLPNTTNIPDVKNIQLKDEILKPIYINKVTGLNPFTENIISTNPINIPYQESNYNSNTSPFQLPNLNLNQSQNFDINKSQNFDINKSPNINISQSFTFPAQEQQIIPTTFTTNSLPYEIKSQTINVSNTYPVKTSLTTSNTYQFETDNIDIKRSLSADELRKKYRTETEIVPVEETEYIPVKKLKYVKRMKVYVPKVKKVIVPKKIVVPIKKTIYVTKPQTNINTITLPTRTTYNNISSINYIPSNNITYATTSYQLPYSITSYQMPYSSTSYQLPYSTTSYQLPYSTSSNQILRYSSQTEYDNDSVALPLQEKEIESKMEEIRPIRYNSPVRNKTNYTPQSPNALFNYSLNTNSRFQSPLRKSHIYTGNLYTPRKYMARSLSSHRK